MPGRRCALEVVTTRATGEALARFAREAQLAASLDAPNLIAVIDVGVSRTVGLFLVMELVTGGSLEKRRARFGDEAWARPLCAQIAAGLAAPARRGARGGGGDAVACGTWSAACASCRRERLAARRAARRRRGGGDRGVRR